MYFDLGPLKLGSHDKVTIDFFKVLTKVYNMTVLVLRFELILNFLHD